MPSNRLEFLGDLARKYSRGNTLERKEVRNIVKTLSQTEQEYFNAMTMFYHMETICAMQSSSF